MEFGLSIFIDNTLVAASSVTILLLLLGVIWLRSSSAKSIDSTDDNFVNDDVQRKNKKGNKPRQKKVKADKVKPSLPDGHVIEQHVSKAVTADVPKTSDVHLAGVTKPETTKLSKGSQEVKKQTKVAENLDYSGEWTTVAATKKKQKTKEGTSQKNVAGSDEASVKDEGSKIPNPNEISLEAGYQPLAVEKDMNAVLPQSVKYSETVDGKVHCEVKQESLPVDLKNTDPVVANHVDEKQQEAVADSNDEGAKPVEEEETKKKKKKNKKSKSSASTVDTGVNIDKDVNRILESKIPEVKRGEDNSSSTPAVELMPSVVQLKGEVDTVPPSAESVTPSSHIATLGEEVSSSSDVQAKTTIVFDELGDDSAAAMTSVSNKKKKKPRREN